MLPDADRKPPGSQERIIHPLVTLLVARNFGAPVLGVGHHTPAMSRASMPEAAVYEHCDCRRAEHEVSGAAETRERTSANAVAEAESM